MTSTKENVTRRERQGAGPGRRREALALLWTVLGLATLVWFHAPARLLDAASGVGSGALEVVGLRSAPAAGPRAAPVADALDRPDFVVRLNPQYSRLSNGGELTLGLQTTATLGFSGRARLIASVRAPAGQAGRLTVRVARTVRVGATVDVSVVARGAASGRYIVTLIASSGGISHVCSALVSVR
jgi:hypothetical protein